VVKGRPHGAALWPLERLRGSKEARCYTSAVGRSAMSTKEKNEDKLLFGLRRKKTGRRCVVPNW
jgi:hypothetical protein